ncbi:uncharacterized protein EAF01_003312 [Botrytis porri]|uniref:uncharacterized protein n=1 Tax=Botrytis porri TaxID=87229 RepID=UPI0019006EE4|nr:uncharacterized protein EAF01_003312 [Botrytis porri]KAF7909594.1 hypothetical protein EAF01_003312 [Botrytis porri]
MIPKTECEIVLVAKIMRIVVEIAAYRQFNPGNAMCVTMVFRSDKFPIHPYTLRWTSGEFAFDLDRNS